jgi:peroxiredoxin-like protein
MQDFPHHYRVSAVAGPEGEVSLSANRLESISSASPIEFGGPGNRWSPESLLVAAVADCFILSFRAVARASKFSWTSLECSAEGTLEKSDGTTRFTAFAINAELAVPQGTREEKAYRLLEKAEAICLVTNSLTGTTHLNAVVSVLP